MDLRAGVRQTVRGLLRDRGYTAVAVLTLGLGIAANTIIFSIVDGVLLRPLNYREPGRLVAVNEVVSEMAKAYPRLPVAASHYYEWRDHASAFAEMGIADSRRGALTGGSEPEQVDMARVSASFLPMLGVRPQLGRTFLEEEDQPGRNSVILISDGLWRRRFQCDAGVVGRSLMIDGTPRTVVGVLPASFSLPSQPDQIVSLPARPDVVAPIAFRRSGLDWGGPFNYSVVARLKPGVPEAKAVGELNALQAAIAARVPDAFHLTATVRDLQAEVTGTARTPLLVLLGAVGAVLLIVCVNLANLALARGTARSRDIAIRHALGATRGRIVRTVLLESICLGLAGGALGIALTWAGLQVVLSQAPIDLPRLNEVRLDARVLLFALGLSTGAGLIFGLLPAWRTAGVDPQQALGSGSRTTVEGRGGRLTRQGLVAMESAVSAVLLTVAALLMASFFHLLAVDKGFNGRNVLTAQVTPPPKAYATLDQRVTYYHALLDRLRTVPGVETAAIVSRLPVAGEDWVDLVRKEGNTAPSLALPPANYRFCSPSYLRAMGVAFMAGGVFTDADRTHNVAVISETTARTVWPGENPIGRKFTRNDPKEPPIEVIGVVRDVSVGLASTPVSTIYVPYWAPNDLTSMTVVLRGAAAPEAVARSLRRAVRGVNADTVVRDLKPMDGVVSDSVATRRFQMLLVTLFAVAAVVLACLGVYGVVSGNVSRRRGEIGLRMALGAASRDVRRMVVGQGMQPVLAGLGAGVIGALAAGRMLGSLLFGVSAHDPLTIVLVTVVLAAVAALACYLPARRATIADPLRALHHE